MPITKEDSIVADSTISSSPPPSTPPPKRSQPRRTYGRPKPAVEEPPLSVYSTTHSDSDDSGSKKRSRDALYQNPRTSEPIGSSPDRTLLDDESFDDSRVTKDASGIMDWNWKAKMKSIDEDEDIITPEKVSKASRPRVEDSENPVSLSAAQREAENPIVSFHPPTSPSDPLSTTGLRGTLSVLTIQSSPTKSPSPAPRVTHTTSRVSESESEREAEQNSLLKSSTKSSKARSSTPPTSDEEMPPKAVSKKSSRSKASRESSDRQPLDLQPEPFEDDVKRGSKKRKGALKKEAREINLERQRLQASKNVSIKEYVPSSSTKKFSVPDLLRNIGTSKPKTKVPESPIDTFSSPFDQHVPQASTSRAQLDSPSRSKVPTLDLDDESDSDDLPPVILSKPLGPKLTGKRAELAQMKERLLQRQSVTKDDDSDDDLEVTDRPDPSASTSVNRQPLVKKESAVARNVQQKLNVAHRKPSVAASGHGRKSFPGVGLPMAISNPADLNKITLRAAQNQAAETRKRKEDEWVRRGGRLESADGQQSSGNMGLAAWVEKGLSAVAQTAREPESNDEEDEEDEDYAPIERGSASPEGSDAEEEDQEDVTMVNDDEEAVQIVSRRTGSRRAVVNSDEEDEGENDENAPPPGQPRHNILEDFSMEVDDEGSSEPVMRRASLSSYATEDEGDKENIDRGENKENQAVAAPLFSVGASRPPLGSRQSSMINLEERASRLSMSPGERVLDEDDDEENQPVRRPLKALRSEESFSPSVPFSTRLQRAESFANTDTAPSPTLGSSPRFAPLVAGGGAKLDFSQFSQEDSAQAFSPKPLQAGFSDLFESGTQKEPLKKNDTDLGGLRRTDTLELTQDVALQPALEVDGSLQRRADAIFEKDQEYVLQAANDSRISALRKEATLYIKDNGFLTQTRPEGSSPEIYRAAPSPSQSQSFERFPLRELPVAHHFVDDIDDSPEPSTQQAKLRRLRKGSPSRSSSLHIGSMLGADSGDELSPPPSPSRRPTKLNAFDILGKKNKDKGQEKKRGPLDKNEFVEDQLWRAMKMRRLGLSRIKMTRKKTGSIWTRRLLAW
ncbi:hypothetical protein VKT23_002395 [Stygiomarasmius scandens]|uniref:DNA replication checkpoint mediator MRC1 domain-containing protein n=1 Tax=Marasmiellus scandens TaxID=2682957 RepID=A0ABR1K1X1_9AGAR